jgi:hypothetical protein
MTTVPVNSWGFVQHAVETIRDQGREFLSDSAVAILHDQPALREAVQEVVANPSMLGGEKLPPARPS